VEAVFLYPWAIILKDLKKMGQASFGLIEMFVYIGIVLVGFWYIWKKGALDWGLSIPTTRASSFTRVRTPGMPRENSDAELAGVAGKGQL
jgi:hypothetical protein